MLFELSSHTGAFEINDICELFTKMFTLVEITDEKDL
jgi:hypothetical protein